MHDYAEAIFHLPTAEGKRAVEVRISGMEPHIKNEFVKQMEYNLSFDFTYMCMADDYKHHIFDSVRSTILTQNITNVIYVAEARHVGERRNFFNSVLHLRD